MAEFDPNVPEIQPGNYIYWSRPIQQPEGNVGAAKLGGAVGSAVEGVAHTSAEAVKDQINYSQDRGTDKILDDWQNRLQTVYDGLRGGGQNDVLAQNTDNTNAPPGQLQNKMSQLDTLDSAMKSGKFSETYVFGQGMTLAKQLRSEFPGFRDYIDERFNHVFGRGLANRAISSIQQNINSYISNKQEFTKNVDTQLLGAYSSGDPNPMLETAVRMRMNGQLSGPDGDMVAMQAVNMHNSQKWSLTQANDDRANLKDDTEIKGIKARQMFGDWSSNNMGNFVQSHMLQYGVNSPDQLVSKLMDPSMDPVQRQGIADQVTSYGLQYKQQALNYLQKTIDPTTKRSLYTDMIGAGYDVDKEIEKNSTWFNNVGGYIKDEKGGPLASAANNITARVNGSKLSALSGPQGPSLMAAKVIQDFAGAQSKWATEYATSTAGLNLGQETRTLVNNIGNMLGAQNSGGEFDPLSGHVVDPTHPMTFMDGTHAVKTALREQNIPETSKTASNAFAGAVLIPARQIVNPDTPQQVRDNLAWAMFGTDNTGFMKEFNKDRTDPQTGAPLLGQSSIFSQTTGPSMDKTVFTRIHDPKIQQAYIGYKKNEFAHTVFPTEVNDLNTLPDNDDYKFGYDSHSGTILFKSKSLDDLPKTSGSVTSGDMARASVNMENARQAQNIQNAVNRINLGLNNMHNMFTKYTHEDPNAFVVSLFSDPGLQSGPVADKIKSAVQLALTKDKETTQ